MSVEAVLLNVLIVSAVTGLVVEALKVCLDEKDVNYSPNLLAGGTAIILGLAEGVVYSYIEKISWSAELVIFIAVLVLLSWLCAMLGYDKVIQTISQLKVTGDNEDEDE